MTVNGRRTSMRLEPAMWEAFDDICRSEGRRIGEVCGLVEKRRGESSLTAAVRVFIMDYYRSLARLGPRDPAAGRPGPHWLAMAEGLGAERPPSP